MLDGAGDAAGDVYLGTYGLAGLAHLVGVADPARVHRGPGAAQGGAQGVAQLLENLEAFGGAYTAAAGHDDVRALQIHNLTGGLPDDLQGPGADVGHGEVEVLPDDLRLLFRLGRLLEHAGADRAHLGPVVRAHDDGHQVAAEGGTGPAHTAGGLIHVQAGAVGGQARVQPTGYPGSQVPTVGSCADEHAGRAVLLDKGSQGGGICVGGVVLKLLAVHHHHLIRAVGGALLHGAVHAAAHHQGHQATSLLVGDIPSGGEQLDAHVLGGTVLFRLYKDPQVLRFRFHIGSSLHQMMWALLSASYNLAAHSSGVSPVIITPDFLRGGT